MLDLAVTFLVSELNSYLVARTGTDFGSAEASLIVDDAGKWGIKEDRLGVALVNVDEERVHRGQLPESVLVDGQTVTRQPALRLNLTVIVAANFQVYEMGLKYLGLVLTFFQAHPTFTTEQFPSLGGAIERLNVELQSLSFEQLNQVWAVIGGKQLPSVIYKVRTVVLQDVAPMSVAPPVREVFATIRER
jgi:hypothetical protein